MPAILFLAREYDKSQLALALEAGVDGLIVPASNKSEATGLSRVPVYALDDFAVFALGSKRDESVVIQALTAGQAVLLEQGWEVVSVENLLASQSAFGRQEEASLVSGLALEVGGLEQAHLASGILDSGVPMLALNVNALPRIQEIVTEIRYTPPALQLETAEVLEVRPVGLGHRVCVDTLSLLHGGQGMLIGNSAAFTFLVQAETEYNEYVAARPFRINAGAVHSYAFMSGDRTCYLEEIKPGDEVLIVGHQGKCGLATVGRIKIERRPMLLVCAKSASGQSGTVFLQNAETIYLLSPQGQPIRVVDLHPGQKVLCRQDAAGRHFGMRIQEDIKED
jgi:3-dehydroquinate synthase II